MKPSFISVFLFFILSSQFLLSAANARLLSMSKQRYRQEVFTKITRKTIAKILNQNTITLITKDSTGQKFFSRRIWNAYQHFNFPTKEMVKCFKQTVQYFTEEGLKRNQVFFVNGVVYRANGEPYHSRNPLRKKANGKVDGDMIVMDSHGNTFIHTKNRGIIHHSSFFSQRAVAFAGMIQINQGKIVEVLAHTGRYLTTQAELNHFNSMRYSRIGHQISRYDTLRNSQRNYLILDKENLDPNNKADDIIIDHHNNLIYNIRKSPFAGAQGFNRTLEKIDLQTGKVLDSLELFESIHDPERIVELSKHFVIMGSWNAGTEDDGSKVYHRWVAMIDKSCFNIVRIKWLKDDYESLKPTAVDLRDNIVILTGLKNGMEVDHWFNPETGALWNEEQSVEESIHLQGKHWELTFKHDYKEPLHRDYTPVARDFSEKTIVSVDRNNKKIWGLRKLESCYKVFTWDLETRELLSTDTIYHGPQLKIIGFRNDGTPILIRYENSSTSLVKI